MGDITELILEGVLCDVCGCYIDDDTNGYPRTCEDCEEEAS
jgi:hypothetical protein